MFEATTEGVFTDISNNTDVENNATIRLWRDINPQKSIGDKPIMKNGDIFSSGTTLAAANGTEPKYISSGINGVPSVYFDGGDIISSTDGPTLPLISADKTYSMFAVFRADLGKAVDKAIITQIGGTTLTEQTYASIGFKASTETANGNPGLITGSTKILSWVKDSTIADQTDYIVGAVVDFVSPAESDATSVKLYVNSLTPVALDTGKTAYAKTEIDATKFTIGATTASSPGSFFTGMISEVIIFDRKLKDEEAQSVMRYLRKKYNIGG